MIAGELMARREDLLRKKDNKRREHRSLADRAHDARHEVEEIETELRDLEKEEIQALKDQDKALRS